jgi:polyhydroxybutyrate depolymerase
VIVAPAALALALAVLGATVAGDTRAGTLIENQTLVHDGVTRWFDLYLPDGLGGDPVALLFLLHGGTQDKSALRIGAPSVFLAIADREGILLAIPNGTVSPGGTSAASGSFNWNDCRGDAAVGETPADDVGFLSALLTQLTGTHPVDPSRVYSAGASNGGMMSLRLALELSDRIAAVGAVIANLAAQSQCPPAPAHPISVLIMNGTADAFVPWAGGLVAGNRGTVISALATRDFFRNALATEPDPMHTLLPDLDPFDAGRAELDLYTGGADGSELAFYTLTNAGHNYPSIAHPLSPLAEQIFGRQNHDLEAAEEIWAFLGAQRLTGASPVPALPSPALFGLGALVALGACTWARRGSGGRHPRSA